MYDMNELRALREEAKRRRYSFTFPESACHETSYYVGKAKRWEVKRGDFAKPDGSRKAHWWNYDPRTGKQIDFTAGQFGDFPDILILDPNSEEARRLYKNVRTEYVYD